MNKLRNLLNEQTRAYIYYVLAALGAVAIFYGKITEQELVVWLALIAEVLGVSLAASNTSTSPSKEA